MSGDVSRPTLKWSTQLNVLSKAETPLLKGDKILLPQSSLEQLLAAATVVTSTDQRPRNSSFDPFNPYSFAAERQSRQQVLDRHQNLPHPLIFRLVNPENGNILYAGIREFSAPENTIGLSSFCRTALEIPEKDAISPSKDAIQPRLTVHVEELPKGLFVKLRPLEAGYDVEDWKAFLEQHLREAYTTLTKGEEIIINAGKNPYRFLVDELRPNPNAISLVDTDLEVDIEPLNEEQARETLQKLAEKTQKGLSTKEGSSPGGQIEVCSTENGQVRPFEYVDYTLAHWDAEKDIEIEVMAPDGEGNIDLFVTPFSPRQRSKPRDDYHILADMTSEATKKIKVSGTNADFENAEAIWISVRCWALKDQFNTTDNATPLQYKLSISYQESKVGDGDSEVSRKDAFSADEEICSNCQQCIPKRTMFLHQNFCLRNNAACPRCRNVFQKSSNDWKHHWHCQHDHVFGNTQASKAKHDNLFHASRICPSCDYKATNTPDIAFHRTTSCPVKLILCQFCHLQVPQQGPEDPSQDSAEVLLSGLAPHEVTDGGRTTECHLCSKIVRLRDMAAHLKHHDLQRLSRPVPRICKNANCGRTVDTVTKTGEIRRKEANDVGLCKTCFGPFYVSQYDPDGKALRRRVERKYLGQLLTGCNQSWCRNVYCKTGRKHTGFDQDSAVTSKAAGAMIKPLLDGIKDMNTRAHFCTDETSQARRSMAEMLAAEGDDSGSSCKGKGRGSHFAQFGYQLDWCVAALEAEGGSLDKARSWLQGFAPRIDEVSR